MMQHIFETTVRGLIKHYSTYSKDNTLVEEENGAIYIKDGGREDYLKIVSNTDSFVLSIFTTDTYVPDATVYFCDGSIGIQLVNNDELRPYGIGGYWTVRDIFANLDSIFKILTFNSSVFSALVKLAHNVESEVLSVLKGIDSQFRELRIENKYGPGFIIIPATPKCPNHSKHLLKIRGGFDKGVYSLEFDIGTYIVDEGITINHPMHSVVPWSLTGNIYLDIRESLVAIMEGAIITDIDPDAKNNFVKASLLDVINILAPRSEVEETKVVEDTLVKPQSDYDIVTDFANLVLAKEQYDVAMYLKHGYAHEVVLYTKTNICRSGEITELPLFRLTIIDGIVIVHFTFRDPACVVSIYMLPGYENDILDKVTIVIKDDIMYKRGVSTIHGITRDVPSIMNGAIIALGHAVAPQYGRFASIMDNINPILTSMVSGLELNSKVIYPVA